MRPMVNNDDPPVRQGLEALLGVYVHPGEPAAETWVAGEGQGQEQSDGQSDGQSD